MRLVLRRGSSRPLDRPALTDALFFVFFSRCTTPTGPFSQRKPKNRCFFFAARFSSLLFLDPASSLAHLWHWVGGSRQINAKVAVRCKSQAFPLRFSPLEYPSRPLSSLLRDEIYLRRRELAWTETMMLFLAFVRSRAPMLDHLPDCYLNSSVI